jgi:hypothetical protein
VSLRLYHPERVRDRSGKLRKVTVREEKEVSVAAVWEDHPFVRRATSLAAEAGDPSPLRVVEELLGVMHEVEDRFPGVPYREIISDRAQMSGFDLRRIRATLRKNGACEADIALVCPMSDDLGLNARRAAMKTDPYHEESERL